MDSLPDRLDKSSCTKSFTDPIAPPPPPPPQAVSVVASIPESNMFLVFLTIICSPQQMHLIESKIGSACKWMIFFVRKSKLKYFALYCFIVGISSILYSIF